MLKKFYGNTQKYSFPFQMMAYVSRLALLKDAIRDHPNAIFISERSLFTDKFVFAKMLYDMGNIEDVCYQIYCMWFDSFIDECPVEQTIYVRTDPEICHHRTKLRGREGEEVIPLDYLKSCHAYHESMMTDIKQYVSGDQLILDGNINIYEQKNQLELWKQQVAAFIEAEPLHKVEKDMESLKLNLSSRFGVESQ